MRIRYIAVALLVATSLFAGCRGGSATPALNERSTTRLLDAARTRAEIATELSSTPRCLAMTPDKEACEWRLSRRDRHYRELARAMDVRDRIGVICELPRDGSPRSEGSCTFHQRRSNRSSFGHPVRGKPTAQHKAEIERFEQRVSAARDKLDGAVTLIEMTRLLGELASRCDAAANEARTCEWILSNDSYGHGTVAASISARMHQKVRFTCRFGPDGLRVGSWQAIAL